MGYLATGEIFENMLQLKRFGLYFEGIMNRKWLLSNRNNDISYRDARVFESMLPEKILKKLMQSGAFFMHYFDRLSFKKVPLFIIKNIDYSYTPGYTSCYVLFCSLRNF